MANKPLLLLVEDSPTQAKLIEDFLIECGAQIVLATDGHDAIRAVAKLRPRAVILDVKLPTMNGFQVTRRLKRNPATADVPIILLTQLEGDRNLMDGMNSGADYYIPKDTDFAMQLWRTLVALGIFVMELE